MEKDKNMYSCYLWQHISQFFTEDDVVLKCNGPVNSPKGAQVKQQCIVKNYRSGNMEASNEQRCENSPNETQDEKRQCVQNTYKNNNSFKLIYARKKFDITALILIYFLFGNLLMDQVFCQTIKCPVGCLCIYGEDNQRLMETFLNNKRQIDAWISLKRHYDTINTYFCSNSNTHTIPKGATASARALFFDDNMIRDVKSTDLVPDSHDYNVVSPTTLLSMSNNEISSIDESAFLPLLNLRYLLLRNNSISDLRWLSSNLPNFKRLSELDLSSNKITKLEFVDTRKFESLTRLDLSDNRIDSLDGNVLSKFPQLEHLDLSSNLIKSHGLIPSSFVMFSIRTMLLSNNELNSIENVLRFLKQFSGLETLDLSKNRISSREISTEAFLGLSELRSLNLSGCSIETFRHGWLNGGPDKSLEVLDLSHNSLTSISAYSLSSVFTLDLNSSDSRDMYDTTVNDENLVRGITQIPRKFVERRWLMPLKRLAFLFLNNNRRLTRIEDDTFDFLPNLTHLFLQNCKIRRLNIASVKNRYGGQPVTKTLPQLRHIWIFGNPIICDCYVRFIIEWTISISDDINPGHIDAPSYEMFNHTKSINVEVAVCLLPMSHVGQVIATTSGREMVCQDEPYSILIAMLIGPLAFAGSVLLTIICGSIHACFVRMKKGAVLSYRAREELMKKPSNGVRRRAAPPHIFNGFGWSRPVPQDGNAGYSAGRTGKYTNIVLGQLGQRPDEHQTRSTPQFPIMTAHSTTSLMAEEQRSYRNETKTDSTSAVPLLVKEAGAGSVQENQNSNSRSAKEGIKTRGSHASNVPFIDEKYQQQTRSYSGKKRSSSGPTEENPLLGHEKRNPSFTTLSESREDTYVMTSSGSEKSYSSMFAIPKSSSESHESTEEVCL